MLWFCLASSTITFYAPSFAMPDKDLLADILSRVASGTLPVEDAVAELKFEPFRRMLDGVTVDTHRELRTGMPETVFARGKSTARLLSAVAALAGDDGAKPVLASRVSPEQGAALKAAFPGGVYWPEASIFALNREMPQAAPWPDSGEIMVVTAGTSDMPVALEALATVIFHGIPAGIAADIGVAGLHRVSPWLPVFEKASALIVVAGMEGALPSVMAGLTGKPVIAVPTSVGYGVALGGFAALAGMLASCAPGIAVVNIDNGYGAAMFAARLIRMKG
ncbi:MAG: nickel pincer cofactor biosynthesis protein LarB [Deltaproteobacteria bacterium]|jgi:NCAIR mutase (PurE)-related protein|nr:nickel pincer cofactor biosynthesis protein LarB [Deltaproteobacteria bacterium]